VRLQAWVDAFHQSFDTTRALADLAAVTRHDRYQASAGIQAAAVEVAEAAAAAGLLDVEVYQFPADGAERWWTFRAPVAWTPRRAELRLVNRTGGSERRFLAYPDQPYCLATHSAATPSGGLTALVVRQVEGLSPAAIRDAVVLLDDPSRSLSETLRWLSEHHAMGLVAVSPFAGAADMRQVGRIELAARSPLFAFSVTSSQMDELTHWARRGGQVRVAVETVTTGMMPVVTARLPGAGEEEALLLAHLCHARPGANDNASGVAALLGIGRTLASLTSDTERSRTIRFLWGPEFVGLAAYLADIVGRNLAPVPFAAVNLDMAGENQLLCGGPLIVERAPDHLPSWLSAMVEGCVRLLPQASRSFSGAVPCDTWSWRATPFAGASDHSLLADRCVACPSVQLGHWPDRFNHSSADTIDKVDPDELRRTACVAGAAVAAACHADPEDGAEMEALVLSWASARLLECLPPATAEPPPRPGWVDPLDPALQAQRLAHRTDLAVGSVLALGSLYPSRAGRHQGLAQWLRGLAGHIRSLVAPVGAEPDEAQILVPSWAGPFNLRGLTERVNPLDRAWMLQLLEADRGRNYAMMLALAHAIDARTGRGGVLRRAAFTSGLPIEISTGERFLDVLLREGWVCGTGP
jgi:hypothetical protein